MQLKEKMAYIKGLMEGLGINAETKEGKVLLAMQELMEELCETVEELDTDMDQVYDELDAMDSDMDELETYVYGEDMDEEDEDEELLAEYELTCPNCGEVTVVDEETLLGEEISCQNCGAEFDIEFGDCDCDGDCEGECGGCGDCSCGE